jgi:N-acetyl-gamma-glutamylphosphate reductase
MAKKAPKNAKSNELDGKEFFTAISLIEKEKGIPKAYMLEKITQALVSAYKRDHEGITDNVFVEANELAGTNELRIVVCGNDERTTVTALFDNLGKGASGAAVQNMNIVLGIDETTGLV